MFQVDSIVYQSGYSKVMTIDANVTVEAVANGFNFGTGTANIDFKDATSKLQADAGNSQLNNFEFYDANGTVLLNGGTLTVGNTADSDTFSDFFIGGTLIVNNKAKMKFQAGAGLTIYSGGQLNLGNTQTTSLWSPATTGGILDNWGTFSFIGSATGNPTEIDMAFLNHGSATFDTGQLKIVNQSASTNNYSLLMDQGSITLNNGVTLYVDQGYDQTGGLFSVADATPAFLTMAASNAEFDGGNVQLGTRTTFGTLFVNGGDLTFNGAEYDAKINGQTGGVADLITTDRTHAIHIKGTSKLVVTTPGAVAPFNQWGILLANSGTAIDGDFNSKTLPTGDLRGFPDGSGNYVLQS